MSDRTVTVVGGGLAGAECALFLADVGVAVTLNEMRPTVSSPAHRSGDLAELVCSNSLGSDETVSGKGLLKEELRRAGGRLLKFAELCRVPAGKALAVDRDLFGRLVTAAVEAHPRIGIVRAEATDIPDGENVVMACGPLPSEALASRLAAFFGDDGFYFYDAISPIVEADSIDLDHAFVADRWGKGDGDYLNLPLTREEYGDFLSALSSARLVPTRAFEEPRYFESCMPIEEMARRGPETLLFGPMRPVGLRDPRSGKNPFAVVQLRKENVEGTMYNLVGFQTRMAYPEQDRVFATIPGLRRAKYLRHGSVHRNAFVDGRRHLTVDLESKARPGLFFAGQLTGVEGYVESIATGFAVGVRVASRLIGKEAPPFPPQSVLGALLAHITTPGPGAVQPMNANFGLLPLPFTKKKRERKGMQAEAALAAIDAWRASVPWI